MKTEPTTKKYITDEKIIHDMSKDHKPIASVKSGETFIVKTRKPGIPDEVFEKDYSEGDYPARILSITGPIEVAGSKPGDILEIKIEDIQFDNTAKMWMGQWMGILMDETDKPYLKKVAVLDDGIQFTESIQIPFRPMIGTLGVAPAGEAIPCLYPGQHGANIDVPTVSSGNTLYLEVQVDGALLAVGDVHAAMGNGEILGTGVEIGSEVTLTVTIRKDLAIEGPLVETPETYEFVTSDKDLLTATKTASKQAIRFVAKETGLSFEEAYALVGQTGNLKIAQVVNPLHTVTMEIPKYYLGNKEKGGN